MSTEKRAPRMSQADNELVTLLYQHHYPAKEVADYFDVSAQAIHTKYRLLQAAGTAQVEKLSVEDFIEAQESTTELLNFDKDI